MRLISSAFEHNSEIPRLYTCEGWDVSPPLSWLDVPVEAKSLALIIDDPDAPDPDNPKVTWVHWVLFNIPVNIDGLCENILLESLPPGAKEGINDWKRAGYGGPCPPIGIHRYFHKLYALDIVLPEEIESPTKQQLLEAIDGHVIDTAELIGTYIKQKD